MIVVLKMIVSWVVLFPTTLEPYNTSWRGSFHLNWYYLVQCETSWFFGLRLHPQSSRNGKKVKGKINLGIVPDFCFAPSFSFFPVVSGSSVFVRLAPFRTGILLGSSLHNFWAIPFISLITSFTHFTLRTDFCCFLTSALWEYVKSKIDGSLGSTFALPRR